MRRLGFETPALRSERPTSGRTGHLGFRLPHEGDGRKYHPAFGFYTPVPAKGQLGFSLPTKNELDK